MAVCCQYYKLGKWSTVKANFQKVVHRQLVQYLNSKHILTVHRVSLDCLQNPPATLGTLQWPQWEDFPSEKDRPLKLTTGKRYIHQCSWEIWLQKSERVFFRSVPFISQQSACVSYIIYLSYFSFFFRDDNYFILS